ncbi:hypothetical protein CR513_34696, partial [Mucuna pruriens]
MKSPTSLFPLNNVYTLALISLAFDIKSMSEWHASKVLELIHVDICIPIKAISNSGKRYFYPSSMIIVVMVGWVYLLSENQKLWNVSRPTRNLWKRKKRHPSSVCGEQRKRNKVTTYNIIYTTPKQSCRTQKQNNLGHGYNLDVIPIKSMSNTCYKKHHALRSLEQSLGQHRPCAHTRSKTSFPCILLGVSDESKGYLLFDPNTKRVVLILGVDVSSSNENEGVHIDEEDMEFNSSGENIVKGSGAKNEAINSQENMI